MLAAMRTLLLLAFPCLLPAQETSAWRQYADPADAGFDAAALTSIGEKAEAPRPANGPSSRRAAGRDIE